MVFENGVKNIQVAAYNGAHTVIFISKIQNDFFCCFNPPAMNINQVEWMELNFYANSLIYAGDTYKKKAESKNHGYRGYLVVLKGKIGWNYKPP